MKKLVVSTLLATLMGVAGAQSVSVYGIVDAGVRYDTSANSSGAAQTRFLSGAQSTSRIGLRGSENIGNGVTAKFNLESGISNATGANSQNGSTGTVLFDRAAWVGLADAKLGEIQLGRNTTASFDLAAAGITDPLSQQLDSVSTPVVASNSTYGVGALRINQAISILGATNGTKSTRADSMIKYKNTIGPVALTIGYAPGGVAGTDDKGSYSANASTTLGPVKAGVGTFTAQDAAGKKLRVNTAGATGTIGAFTLTAGYHTSKTDAGFVPAHLTTTATANGPILGTTATSGPSTDHNVKNVGLKYQVNPKLSSTLAYYKGNYTNGVGSAGKLDTYVLFTQYNLSKRTNLYVEVDQAKASGSITSASVDNKNVGYLVGVRHTF